MFSDVEVYYVETRKHRAGVYISDWGGMRIEDTVLVTDDGYEILTHYPRDLIHLFYNCFARGY